MDPKSGLNWQICFLFADDYWNSKQGPVVHLQ
jgi:hypothetical protein